MLKTGSPLFILRHECEKDLMTVIEKLAAIGFDGIEFLGFFGHKASDIRKKLDSCKITAFSNHVSFNDFIADVNKTISESKEIGCKYIAIGPNYSDGFPGQANYNKTLKTFESISEAMNKEGMTLLYHNHAHELQNNYNGRSFLEHIMDDTQPEIISLELDLGWVQIGGGDPMYYLDKYGGRCPIVHFKDFIHDSESEKGFLFRPTGYGIVDYPVLYKKTLTFKKQLDWYVMDHDHAYDRDIFFDMKISLEYFKNLVAVT